MFCSKCGSKVEDSANFCNSCGKRIGEYNNLVDIEYYAISPSRLALFSILTLGIYEVYWFYKNWQAVRNFEKRNIYPFWRAIFAVFFCYSLFKKVLKSAKAYNYDKSYSPAFLSVIYILLLLISNGVSYTNSYDIWSNIILFVLAVSTFTPLIYVQKAINFNNEKIKGGGVLSESFSKWEVVLIIFGIALFVSVFWNMFLS